LSNFKARNTKNSSEDIISSENVGSFINWHIPRSEDIIRWGYATSCWFAYSCM